MTTLLQVCTRKYHNSSVKPYNNGSNGNGTLLAMVVLCYITYSCILEARTIKIVPNGEHLQGGTRHSELYKSASIQFNKTSFK